MFNWLTIGVNIKNLKQQIMELYEKSNFIYAHIA